MPQRYHFDIRVFKRPTDILLSECHEVIAGGIFTSLPEARFFAEPPSLHAAFTLVPLGCSRTDSPNFPRLLTA